MRTGLEPYPRVLGENRGTARDRVPGASLPQAETVIPSEKAGQSTSQNAEEIVGKLSDDLFLLEMLGEDEGILEDTDRVETDVEFLAAS